MKLVNDEAFSNAIKALEKPIGNLSVPTTQTNSTRAVRTHGHPNYGQRAYGAVDFYLESKDNSGNNDVSFAAPTNVKVVGIHQNYGPAGYGNYIDVEVQTPFGSNLESKHNLNKGDVIRIAHARSGHTDSPWPVQVGDVISAGNPLGRQHTVNSYKTNVDGGTGMHLHVELRRGGSNINQIDMVTIFNTILQTGLAD